MLRGHSLEWFGWTVIYLMAHLLLYVLVLRRARAFSKEKVVFSYHALSALILVSLVTGARLLTAESGTLMVGAGLLALHGIYSLSFLELWSLAEGGYSLRILDQVDAASGVGVDLADVHRFGTSKKVSRIEGLKGLRLVRREGEWLGLTRAGRFVAMALLMITWLANVKRIG